MSSLFFTGEFYVVKVRSSRNELISELVNFNDCSILIAEETLRRFYFVVLLGLLTDLTAVVFRVLELEFLSPFEN